MPKNNELSSKDLEKRIDLLIKRFEEQKGIIDSYVKREREWKKDKVLHRKEISRLERDLTIACPPKEKDNLIKAAALLNEELDNISDKNNALIIAGLTLSNKLLNDDSKSTKKESVDYSKLIKKIEKVLQK